MLAGDRLTSQEVTATAQSVDVCCQSCGATLAVEAHLRTAQCPYCDSPSVIERPTAPDRPDPSFVVGFVLDQKRATAAVRRWISRRGPFVRSGFKKATIDKVRGVYLPTYLYNAVARSRYQAEIGENYTVTETYTTTDSSGKTVTRTRTRTKTEYRHLSGEHACYLLDVVVTASAGVGNDELEAVEPFDLRTLRRYSPALLSGWMAEEPSISLADCVRQAHDESITLVGKQLSRFMPGDSHRNLRYETQVSDQVTDLVLLPVWVFAARYADNQPPVRILVNGQTGKSYGKVPLSFIKIALASVAGLGLIALLWFLLSS